MVHDRIGHPHKSRCLSRRVKSASIAANRFAAKMRQAIRTYFAPGSISHQPCRRRESILQARSSKLKPPVTETEVPGQYRLKPVANWKVSERSSISAGSPTVRQKMRRLSAREVRVVRATSIVLAEASDDEDRRSMKSVNRYSLASIFCQPAECRQHTDFRPEKASICPVTDVHLAYRAGSLALTRSLT